MRLQIITLFTFLSTSILWAKPTNDTVKSPASNNLNPEHLIETAIKFRNTNLDSALYYAQKALIASKLQNDNALIIRCQLELSSNYLYKKNTSRSIQLIEEAKQLALQTNDSASICKIQNHYGTYFTTANQYDSAIYHFKESLYLCDKLNIPSTKIANLIGLGIIYWERGDLELALNQYLDGYKIAEEINDINYKIPLLLNMGIIYSDENQIEKAYSYYNQVLELAEQENRLDILSIVYNNIAILNQEELKFDEALTNYKKSLDMRYKIGDKAGAALALNNIGENYYKIGDNEKAILYLYKSLDINRRLQLETDIVYNLENLAKVYLKKGNYKKAFAYLDEGNNLSNKLKLRKKNGDFLLLLGEYYNKTKDHAKAYSTILKYNSLKDSLHNESRSDKIAQLQTKFDSKQKEKENEILKVKNQYTQEKLEQEKLRTNYLIAFSSLAILVIALVFILLRSKVRINNKINSINGKLEDSNSKLKTMNATKDKFFSIIAHDLRSPFNAILGFSELIKAELETSKDLAVLEEYNSSVNESANNLLNLLENLLQWANSQRGQLDFSPVRFDLYELVQSNLDIFKLKTTDKSIKLHSDIKPDTFAYGDVNMINTIVRNLISNALKFTNSNGEVFLSAREEGDFIFLSVKDTGIGISKANQEKLFRLDCNYTTYGTNDESGSGLGLILCKEFVNKNGGKIWVESEENKGSNFIFSLKSAKNYKPASNLHLS